MTTKLKAFGFIIIGLLLGVIITAIALNLSTHNMMIKEIKSPYDIDKTVNTLVERINSQNGWHVVAIIDQNEAVSKSGGKPIGNFKIIQYCNGKYSSEMLSDDSRKKLGTSMPKSFAVYQKKDGQVYIATANGMIMGKLYGGETEEIIEKVSLEVENILRFVNFKFSIF